MRDPGCKLEVGLPETPNSLIKEYALNLVRVPIKV